MKIIEIKEEVQIGDIILEVGDKFEVMKEGKKQDTMISFLDAIWGEKSSMEYGVPSFERGEMALDYFATNGADWNAFQASFKSPTLKWYGYDKEKPISLGDMSIEISAADMSAKVRFLLKHLDFVIKDNNGLTFGTRLEANNSSYASFILEK